MATGLPATSLIPGATNLATMQREVLSWCVLPQEDPELNDLAGSGINDGILKLSTRNWRKLLRRQDIPLEVDEPEYELNQDFRAPRQAQLLDSSDRMIGRIEYKEQKTFDLEHVARDQSGDPYIYTIRYEQRGLELCVPPAQGYVDRFPTLRLRYHYRHPKLIAPASTLSLPPEYELFVKWHAREYVAGISAPARVREANFQAMLAWDALVSDDCNDNTDWSED